MKVENQRIDSISSPNSSSRAARSSVAREDVEDPAADRELAALVDLVDALVAGLDQQLGDVAEVDLLAAVEDEAVRAQRGVGHRLGERDRAGDDDRRLVARRSRSAGRARRARRSAARPGAAAARGGTRSPVPREG